MRRVSGFALLVALAVPVAAQTPPMPEYPALREAYLAWDRGDYPAALRGYLEVLNGPDGARHLEEIALLTGELYRVTELAPDGAEVRTGPAGRLGLFEVTTERGTATRVVDLESASVVESLDGTGATVSPEGSVAYFRTESSSELQAALEEAARLRAQRDYQGYFAARARAAWLEIQARTVLVRRPDGSETALELGPGVHPVTMTFAPGSEDLFLLTAEGADPGRLEVRRSRDGTVERLEAGAGPKAELMPVPGGRYLIYSVLAGASASVTNRSRFAPSAVGVAIVDLMDGGVFRIDGVEQPTLSADGSTLAFLRIGEGESRVETVSLNAATLADPTAEVRPRVAARSDRPLASPALSPDGRRVAFQIQDVHDWEIWVAPATGGSDPDRVTREIQHDLYPRWLDHGRILAVKGEGRHRRSYVYDLATGVRTKLFHNNTVRTIAPEYEWAPSPDGRRLLVVSERDGDTVSPERGVYLLDMTEKVTVAEVRDRLEENLAAEVDLRRRGEAAFRPIAADVTAVVGRMSVGRVYQYARDLYRFGSKHITMPGNDLAIEYLTETLRSWGYEPELQWFEPQPGLRTANIVVRIPGTENPELVHVVSSHFDSTQRGPGADDDSSGTTALLEVARVLKGRPRAATIELAFFTGEEAGLLGSREYVRRAVEGGKRIVGALNNDMVGWANNHRLDNTIRYSNPGIRDIQHAAAIQFSDLITYDALYYKSTDAAAYYEEYGDIVGGIGSYPVLGNPHYHQYTDRLETIDHDLVLAVGRTTAATVMLLASSPSRVTGLTVEDGAARWDPLPEDGIRAYEVRWEAADGWRSAEVDATSVRLEGAVPGGGVRVRGLHRRGTVGWDWARATVPDQSDRGG